MTIYEFNNCPVFSLYTGYEEGVCMYLDSMLKGETKLYHKLININFQF